MMTLERRHKSITVLKPYFLPKRLHSTKGYFIKAIVDFNPFLPPKSPRFSLLVSYNIQPSSSSTNQNAALIIDHQLDFTKSKICYKHVMSTSPERQKLVYFCSSKNAVKRPSLRLGGWHKKPTFTFMGLHDKKCSKATYDTHTKPYVCPCF